VSTSSPQFGFCSDCYAESIDRLADSLPARLARAVRGAARAELAGATRGDPDEHDGHPQRVTLPAARRTDRGQARS
jgi:hypothetical protein